MDEGLLEDMNEDISDLVELGYNIHSVLIVRKGYLVAEQYYSRYFDQELFHKLYSCTKSVISALVGIAISEGYISGTDAKMIDYFQEYEIENLNQQKQSISLEHMLTMSAGLDWNELDYLYSDPRNNYYQWTRSDDWIQYILDRPMEYAPGAVQDYNSGLSELLSVIIQKTSGIRADSFAVEKLFSPLGIDAFYWSTNPEGYTRGGSGLRMSPRNMAKFGHLYITQGKWGERQILPADWIQESGNPYLFSQHMTNFSYGYQFWVSDWDSMYTAHGFGGQWIMIVPEHDLVVVFNNHFNEGEGDEWITPIRLYNEYIVPSITDSK
jgi:CubicO group peptidase (beta-lactamase class C family)